VSKHKLVISHGSNFMAEQNAFDKFDASAFINLALLPPPSTFGSLVLLADLRDNTDPLAELLYGKAPIKAALQEKHREIFFAWLGLNFAAQMTEVAEHLAAQSRNSNAPVAQLVQRWIHETLYEQLVPEEAGGSERKLFSNNLRTILQLFRVRLDSSRESHES